MKDWTDKPEDSDDYPEQSPWMTAFVFVFFVLPWLFGLGAIVGLLFFNGKF